MIPPEVKLDKLLDSEEVFRLRDDRHCELVLNGTRLQLLEGCLADQYGLSVLDGLHRAHRKAAAVSSAVHLVQHWNLGISWSKEHTKGQL